MQTLAAALSPALDPKDLADGGKRRIEWAFHSMPVLQNIRKQFIKAQFLDGFKVAVHQPLTAATANLCIMLRDAGGKIFVLAPEPEEDVAASLQRDWGIQVLATRPEILEQQPVLLLDTGAELISDGHAAFGAVEITAAGATRAAQLDLQIPVLAVAGSLTSRLFVDKFGAGQAVTDALLRLTGSLLAGSNVLIAGFGPRGRGIAARVRGLGAQVMVAESDPVHALEAVLDGYRVTSMVEGSSLADIIVTASGTRSVLGRDIFEKLKSGSILANAGEVAGEIDLEGLARVVSSRRAAGPHVEECTLRDGRRIHLLNGGRPLQSLVPEPAAMLELKLAAQALAVEYVVRHRETLDPKIHFLPDDIDRQIARMKLESMSITVDRMGSCL